MAKKLIKTKRIRVYFEKHWKNRPYPYWFNAKYPDDGSRRICFPFFTIDIYR